MIEFFILKDWLILNNGLDSQLWLRGIISEEWARSCETQLLSNAHQVLSRESKYLWTPFVVL